MTSRQPILVFSSMGLELAPEDSDRFQTLSRGLSQFNTAMTLLRKQGKKAAAAEGDSGHIRCAEQKKTDFWRLVPVRTKFGPSGQNLFGQKWADRSFLEARDRGDFERDTILIPSSSPEPPATRIKCEFGASDVFSMDLTVKSEPTSVPLPFRTRSLTEGDREVIELLSESDEDDEAPKNPKQSE
ncbi:hypothetical protein B0H10DRAFT_2186723 [Mycena sp. CBHHK59/15]|nr:hypothetical protein B0H10DRAFT_2186723 [Mycena sp. CBHHK59/15]